MPLNKLSCGCLQHSEQHFVYPCPEHVAPRYFAKDVRRDSSWYIEHCCPACGRVNDHGNCCVNYWLTTCLICGLVSCVGTLAHYHLTQETGLICRSQIKPRTKAGKATIKKLQEHPELEATPERVRPLLRKTR